MTILEMSVHGIFCLVCDVEVVQYYDDTYKGKRAKCPICETSFPLE